MRQMDEDLIYLEILTTVSKTGGRQSVTSIFSDTSDFIVLSFYFQVLYSYGIGFVYILIGLVFSGGLGPAFKFCAQVR